MSVKVGGDGATHVPCPCCRNRRLFDTAARLNAYAEIYIKCPVCRNVIQVQIDKIEIRTEQIGV